MISKFSSRKFWMSVVTAVCALFLGVSGALDWTQAMAIIAAALGAYVGIEGLADIVSRLKK